MPISWFIWRFLVFYEPSYHKRHPHIAWQLFTINWRYLSNRDSPGTSKNESALKVNIHKIGLKNIPTKFMSSKKSAKMASGSNRQFWLLRDHRIASGGLQFFWGHVLTNLQPVLSHLYFTFNFEGTFIFWGARTVSVTQEPSVNIL